MLLVEHNLKVVEGLCDTITVLTRGRVLAEGDYAAVSRNPEVQAAYLGADPASVGVPESALQAQAQGGAAHV